MHFREFYFLRSHRVFMLLLRFFLIIVLSFVNQEITLSFDVIRQVELRDIRIKSTRKTIYIWEPNWLIEVK
jgi:hypothetical protein